jgi:hypothetical protein
MTMPDVAELLGSDDMRALVDIGFMALSHGFDAQAATIFAGVIAARPGQEAGYLGTALVHLYRGEVDPAVAILRKLPPTDAARMFLGLALTRGANRAEARAVLSDVVATAQGTPFARGAQDILDASTGQ